MSEAIPEHLKSSAKLIRAAFGDVIPVEDYPALIIVLYDHFSDRNLAELLSHFTNTEAVVVYNDIGKFVSIERPAAICVARVIQKLEAVGLQQWIDESPM